MINWYTDYERADTLFFVVLYKVLPATLRNQENAGFFRYRKPVSTHARMSVCTLQPKKMQVWQVGPNTNTWCAGQNWAGRVADLHVAGVMSTELPREDRTTPLLWSILRRRHRHHRRRTRWRPGGWNRSASSSGTPTCSRFVLLERRIVTNPVLTETRTKLMELRQLNTDSMQF